MSVSATTMSTNFSSFTEAEDGESSDATAYFRSKVESNQNDKLSQVQSPY